MFEVTVWLCFTAGVASGILPLTLIDYLLVLGIGIVLPSAIGGRRWWWSAAAASATVSLLMPRGPAAAALALPVAAASAATLVAALRAGTPRLSVACIVGRLAPFYALVAATALALSRLGVQLFGFREPLVELTAIHYIYAGAAALVLAKAAHDRAGWSGRLAGRAAVALTAVAPPTVALGFVLAHPLPQVGGAVLMAAGVWLTATLELADALDCRVPGLARALLAVSGVAILVPMVLAVGWAAGQYWDVPVLSIPDMARTHGVVNALGFTLCGLAGRHLAGRVAPEPEVAAWSR
jgi:hypothetical protein